MLYAMSPSSPPPPPLYGAGPGQGVPPPPNLHWIIVLLLTVVTFGLFLDVWVLVQSNWIRKFDPKSNAFLLYATAIAASLLAGILNATGMGGFTRLLMFSSIILLIIVAALSFRETFARYITSVTGRSVQLSVPMTIFFGPIYFQYHINNLGSLPRDAASAVAR
jgi:hypothetical protein